LSHILTKRRIAFAPFGSQEIGKHAIRWTLRRFSRRHQCQTAAWRGVGYFVRCGNEKVGPNTRCHDRLLR
jgi:hypothetical protein